MKKRLGPRFIKLFPYSTQLHMKFILLINTCIRMPTADGNLIFISRINCLLKI